MAEEKELWRGTPSHWVNLPWTMNKQLDEVELYRVRDYKLQQPFFLRLFGLGNILMQTSDRSHPTVRLRAVRDGERLYEQIRSAVEACRARKGVRELDVE